MVNFKVGNSIKQISNDLYTKVMASNVDASYWYSEIFGTLPIYTYYVYINRSDEDEDFDIFNVIYNDLIRTGDFEPLMYEYSKYDGESKNHPNTEVSNRSKSHKDTSENDKKYHVSQFYLILKNEPAMIYYDYDGLHVMSHLGTEKISEIVEKYLKDYDQEDTRIKCYVIVKEPDLYLSDFDIELDNDLDFDLYNDGFKDVHNSIKKSIENDKNGLYLLYGKPGTGKSTYIRHLIKECGDDKRKFIYVPSKLFEDFTDPTILPFLLRNKGCVFIIEDCENLVTVDDGIRSDSITDLLNMTDGLLADALNIKIICTFNTDYEKIDDALMRPGRCKCKYEFNLLDKEKANKVAKKFGLGKVDKDISLAELFNPELDFVEEKKRKIGFAVN